jgi:formylglycine-generating enzyme required for sulfatase activity
MNAPCRHLLDESPLLRRLDRVPFHWALLIGAVVGLTVTAGVVLRPSMTAFAVTATVIALSGVLAWTARPVGVWDRPPVVLPSFLDMVAIEGGTFVMGSPEDEPGRSNEKQHEVTLTPFEISRTTVTRAQYREIMEIKNAPGSGGDDHPVTKVNWFDAVAFCNRLSEREGLIPCYRMDGNKVDWVEDAGGYRLPTEAEWEYAARAGSKGRWPFPAEDLDRFAWYGKNSGRHSHEVATRDPNPWGLRDMHGNVWEWCWDGYAEYPSEPVEDPRGPEAPGGFRVLRGGSFILGPRNLRSADRNWDQPVDSNVAIGFRCVRRPRRQLDRSTS